MKIHLIKKQSIMLFVSSHARSKSSFDDWLTKIKYADWDEPHDILKTFNSADFLGRRSNRIVFNIGGNEYRMICTYFYGRQSVHLYVCWIGTHAEYSKLCQKDLQYNINEY